VTRPFSLAAALLVLAVASGCDDDSARTMLLEDRVLGDPEAPVTIVEYASLTCSHCASFHRETLPLLKKEWLDTGRAKLVYRDFPLDKNAATAAVIARCAPKEHYFRLVGAMFKRQNGWGQLDDPVDVLARIAQFTGLTRADIDACLADQKLVDGVLQMRLIGQEENDINSTPSFVIDGRLMRGALGFRDFDAVLRSKSR
jgi:protein-disulfide isomerase